jgi:hypothetical protein
MWLNASVEGLRTVDARRVEGDAEGERTEIGPEGFQECLYDYARSTDSHRGNAVDMRANSVNQRAELQ